MTDDKEPTNVIRVSFGKTEESSDPDAAKKLEAFSRLIDEGMVMVTLDARMPNVVVPAQHKDDLQLGLNFSHRFAVTDFEYDLKGVRASLSFGGVPHRCDLPWESVYMLRSHVTDEVVFFKAAFPDELARQRTELYVHLEARTPKVDDAEALLDKLRQRQHALGTPPGLLGMHTMRNEEGALVEMSIWVDRAHFDAATDALATSSAEADLDAVTDGAARVSSLEEV
jgi:heme-degrading monooxygenase HmoA